MAGWDLDRLIAALSERVIEKAHETSWIVLTGAPMAGKSTVLKALSESGHQVREEQARIFLEQELERGVTFSELVQDGGRLVEEIFRRNYTVHAETCRDRVVVFDRGLPDVLAFGLIDGVELEPYIERSASFRFAKAIVFDRVPRRASPTTYHTERQMKAIEDACAQIYEALGAEVTRAPLMTVDPTKSLKSRTQLVEQAINQLCNKKQCRPSL